MRGKLVLENDTLTFTRNQIDMVEFARTSREVFAKPPGATEQIPIENALVPHATMMCNFVAAILDGTPLIAPAEAGVNSVELANAAVYSSLLEQTLDLPMNAGAWERRLNQLIAESKTQKKVVEISDADVVSSFRK